jgi:hypothetical protein
VRSAPIHQFPEGLERTTRIGLQVALTFKPQTQEKLTKKVLEIIAREEGDNDAFIDFLRNPVNSIVITALQEWAEEGKLVYVEEIDSWHKKRAPRSTAAQAAADVLGGDGGVMDRGDALGAGVASDRRRS